jgi:TolB protein
MSIRMKKLDMKKLATFLALAALGVASPVFAQLKLTITQGVTDPIPIAVVPFARAVPADGGIDVAAIVQRDLESSGRFKGMARADMLSKPTTSADIDVAGFKQQRNDYVAVGRLAAGAAGDIVIDVELVNVLTGQRVLGQ